MTEDQLEQEALGGLAGRGYTHLYGPDMPTMGIIRGVRGQLNLQELIHKRSRHDDI